ncbi:MAG: DUF2117 domain-containing protein [ANME-2 cluster archaeon]|nr:DUF2117 domain-containing protein [ANME-2 cluster archaeon]
MTRIGVVIHGPAVIDSGRANTVINIVAGMGEIRSVLGGTMGRAAVIDAGLEDIVNISVSRKPSESVMALGACCDVVLLVNEGKCTRSGLAFGRMVFDNLGSFSVPLIHVEFTRSGNGSCVLIPWNDMTDFPLAFALLEELENVLEARRVPPPETRTCLEIQDDMVRRKVAGVRPGEYVTVNGIVIGKALSDEVYITCMDGEIIELHNGRLKPHGVEKLGRVDLSTVTIRSGPLRTADVTPRILEHKVSGIAVIIDHAAEQTFEIAQDADVAVTVGDDTTAVAGDLLTRLGISLIGIVDGDGDGIIHHAHVPPGSVIIRLASGNDDIVGRRVHEEIFGGQERIDMGDAGFEGVLERVLELVGGLVEDVVRYHTVLSNTKEP